MPKRTAPLIALGYALLGLLARSPCSGYDLIREMEEPVGFFWHARRSQIYPELARLEAAGLARHEVVAQTDRPNKKVYSITEVGLAALREWVAAPMPLPLDRDEFMLKVFSLWLCDRHQAIALVRTHEGYHAGRLAQYREIEERMRRTRGDEITRPEAPIFASYATLRRGIEYEQGYVAWCQWLLDALERA